MKGNQHLIYTEQGCYHDELDFVKPSLSFIKCSKCGVAKQQHIWYDDTCDQCLEPITKEVKIKMDLKEASKEHVPKKTLNVADLEVVPLNAPVTTRTGTDKDGKDFDYNIITIDGDEYRVPGSVLESIKTILEVKPDLAAVKVKKKGEGFKTEYTVIPL